MQDGGNRAAIRIDAEARDGVGDGLVIVPAHKVEGVAGGHRGIDILLRIDVEVKIATAVALVLRRVREEVV